MTPDATPAGSGRAWPTTGQAALFFTAVAALLTWPQVVRWTSVPENVDSYFNLWRIAWIAHQILRDPARLFDANIFHPMPNTLAYSDAVLLEGLTAAPLVWLGVPVVVVYNLLVLGAFVSSALGMFLLVRHLTGYAPAGVIAGLVFAFAPFRFDHYFHLEMLWAQWMPLALWMAHRTVESGRVRDGLWTGLFVALQGLSSIYYVIFFGAVLAVVVPLLIPGRPRGARVRVVTAFAAGGVLAVCLLVPYLMPYRAAHAQLGDRSAGELILHSAGPAHFLSALPGSVLYGRLTADLGRHEKRLFPGFTVMLLVVVGLWPPFDRTRLAYAVALAITVDGVAGHRGVLYPFLREHVFVFRGLRVAARFGQVFLAAVAVLAAYGVHRVAVHARRRGERMAAAAVSGVAALVILEYLMFPLALVPVETSPAPVYQWLRTQPPGAVAELPLPTPPLGTGIREAQVAFRSTFHWRPIVNGYSGHYPESYIALLKTQADFPSDASLNVLRALGVRYLILHERDYGRSRYAAVVRALDERHDVAGFGPFADREGAVRAYRLLDPESALSGHTR